MRRTPFASAQPQRATDGTCVAGGTGGWVELARSKTKLLVTAGSPCRGCSRRQPRCAKCACVLANRNIRERDITVSLWTPWERADLDQIGPERFDVPDKLWFLGLGHLGQAFVWNLCFLPGDGERLAVLQDDQTIGEENEATSLLVLPEEGEKGERKTRLSARWLEACGWHTQFIERRHQGDIVLTGGDPPFLLSGLDRLQPRLTLAKHGFPFMIDAGVGHGPGDFEGIQVRTVVDGKPVTGLWNDPEIGEAAEEGSKGLLETPTYLELEKHVGVCGKLSFAEASVAVPFVGAATGALVIAQAIRLASLQPAPVFLQMELGAPDMATVGGLTASPEVNLGSFSVHLQNCQKNRPTLRPTTRSALAGTGD